MSFTIAPKQLLYGEIADGKCTVRQPCKDYKDLIKPYFNRCDIANFVGIFIRKTRQDGDQFAKMNKPMYTFKLRTGTSERNANVFESPSPILQQ